MRYDDNDEIDDVERWWWCFGRHRWMRIQVDLGWADADDGYKTRGARSISILDPHTLETDQRITYRINRASTERLSARELRDKM